MSTKNTHPTATFNRKKKELRALVFICIALMLLCIILNIEFTPTIPWFIGPLLGFGAIIYANYMAYLKAEENLISHNAFQQEEDYLDLESLEQQEMLNADAWEEREIEKELNRNSPSNWDDSPTIPDDELELKEFKKLREEWNDQDFV